MRKTTILSLAAATFAAAAALPAQAENVAFSGFANGSKTVTFTLSTPNVDKTATVSAGGFLTSLNGGPSFTSYCVDVYQTIAFGAPAYTEYSLAAPGAHLFANGDAYGDLGRLYATAGVVSDALHEAAFQIAVWEIAYETDATYSLSAGSATFSGGTAASSGALTIASDWLTGLGTGTGPTIEVLESRLHQDVIFAVPEPSTYLLMVMGLTGLTLVARRRAGATGSPARRHRAA